jgi:transposase
MVHVVYVKTTTVRRGNRVYEYVTLVEAVRDGDRVRHQVIARLGEAGALRASGELQRIIHALAAHNDRPAVGEVTVESSLSAGVIAVVAAYWQRLGLHTHFAAAGGERKFPVADAVFAMIANRLADPCSKRALPEWADADVTMPGWWQRPESHHYYRALDVVHHVKASTETHLYARLTDLTNLDLRFVCYDLTSSFFEGDPRLSDRFASKQFGYSRDHRSDRPQIMIGLVMTANGFPLAHHVFPGNTQDATTLTTILADVQTRFGIGPITVVADRGLVTTGNIDAITAAGCGHILATKLHRAPATKAALEASTRPDAVWEPAANAGCAVCDVQIDGQRMIVVASIERHVRDLARTTEFMTRTETKLTALEQRVRNQAKHLRKPKQIAVQADRILRDSPVGRCYDTEITDHDNLFLWHYNTQAIDYEQQLLTGRWVLTTSHTPQQLGAAQVLDAYRQLLEVESTFRVLKDVIELRPMRHWTETRVHAHIAICVYAALIEALINQDLHTAHVADPDLAGQTISPRRALHELGRVHHITLDLAGQTITRTTKLNALQQQLLGALGATLPAPT